SKWFTGWSFQADDLWYVFGFWVLGLVLLSVTGKALSGLTLRSIEEDDPNDFKSKRHVNLRKFYRLVINIAAVYYYLSVPVVICLLLAAAGAITYGFFMLGHVPLRLVVIVIVGALVTAGLMIRSLFVRGKSTDPGRAIRFQEAPGLWKLTREVSSAVGTQPVDEIRLTPGTDLAVYENRSSRGRKGGKAKRVLLLGAGVLNGFSLNAFRAVLAHEYGHLSHRDTAGGEVALRVNANMTSFAVAIVASGQAVWWNLGFWFLRVYHFIFRRLSHGATRLQEVLADRVAVVNYGSRAFEEGLRHVVRRSVEFEEAANSEIVSANQGRRALRNLYDLESVESIHLQNKVSAAISRPTTEDDTHPSPVDRFRYASRIISKQVRPLEGTLWDLFVDREAITNELSNTISERIRAARG
ncbi:MAG: M48 family metallopeptidase, partial [Blastocatellia bacterium]